MTIYQHTQVGTLTLLLLGSAVLFAAALAVASDGHPVSVAGFLAVAVLAILFSSLTVQVSTEAVVIYFGPGFLRRRFPLDEIRGVQPVRNPWYYGWGIRLTPEGWLFNVSGMRAVELELAGGRRFRIGTDQPAELAHAVEQALSASP